MKYVLRRLFYIALIAASFSIQVVFGENANAASRIKDIVYFEGIRENTLLGYGLVVGLNGSGDNLKNSPFTEKGLSDFLNRLGVSTKGVNLKTKNVAAVMITADLPAFARAGNRFDVTVSTIGDAKSLSGGTLLATPLLGADGNVYALAQGRVSLASLVTTNNTSNAIDKSVPTSGIVENGAVVEKEIDFNLSDLSRFNLSLRNPDISTSRRIAENVNEVIGEDAATALDPGTVEVLVPEIYGNNIIGLMADIENIIVQPDQPARIVIDESSGTVVIGEDVKIDTVAVAQGNLLVTISDDTGSATSEGFGFESSGAQSAASVQVSKNKKAGNGLAVIRQGANLRDLVSGLNSLGIGTRDLITILQTIKVAGALHADIEVR